MATARLSREVRTGNRHYPAGTEVKVGGQHPRVNNFEVTFPDGHVMYLGSSWLTDMSNPSVHVVTLRWDEYTPAV